MIYTGIFIFDGSISTHMHPIISFLSSQGGVGKTTLCVNIGYSLAKLFGKKILLVDLSPCMGISHFFKNSISSIENIESKFPNKSILPTYFSKDLFSIQVGSKNENNNGYLGYIQLDQKYIDQNNKIDINFTLSDFFMDFLNQNKDYIILIDTPSIPSPNSRLALITSDYYITVIRPDHHCLLALNCLINLQNKVTEFPSKKKMQSLGVIPNFKKRGIKKQDSISTQRIIQSIKEVSMYRSDQFFDGFSENSTIMNSIAKSTNKSRFMCSFGSEKSKDSIKKINKEILLISKSIIDNIKE